MTDFELALCKALVACEERAREEHRAHAKNTERASEIMQNALARAENAEKRLAELQVLE